MPLLPHKFSQLWVYQRGSPAGHTLMKPRTASDIFNSVPRLVHPLVLRPFALFSPKAPSRWNRCRLGKTPEL